MKLELKRDTFHDNDTLGKIFIDGAFECYTCEDAVREVFGKPVSEWKVYGKTAIPRGEYGVTITMSNRFQKLMPLLSGVVGFSGIRIHSGNTAADTEGCILVGTSRNPTGVGNSRIAMGLLQGKIQAALDRGETVIIMVN